MFRCSTKGLSAGFLLPVLLIFSCSSKTSSVASGECWKTLDVSATRPCEGKTFPLKYRLLEVDYPGLRNNLKRLDEGAAGDSIDLPIPLPEGNNVLYTLFKVQVMPDALAQKYPDIHTYSGKNKSNASETIRLDISPAGVRAMILSPSGTVFIDPYCSGDSTHVISYYKKDMPENTKQPFEEVIPGDN
ncbi:MAG TPA: hypothetical protein VFW78_05395 [Bacteroidia bacterium]|nr:hypothetical protein [Bacteroidia bacterium]